MSIFKHIYASIFKRCILGTFVAFTGDALRKLEERGVVIRFVIGRRFFQQPLNIILCLFFFLLALLE